MMSGPLISAKTTMTTAWEVPKNPETDPTLKNSPVPEDVKLGFKIFMNTPTEGRFGRNKLSCNNCHLNAGQRERAMPLVGLAGMFPEYNKRSARTFALADRVVDCFVRSENGTAALEEGKTEQDLPTPASKEVLAVVAYLTWLSDGYPVGKNPAWRGKNAIAADKLLPREKLDPVKGEAIFSQQCVNCHAADGQGVQVGDKKPGPLWGPESWNDGAGAARVYTLAGMIRYMMPYLDPGSLSDEDAQHVAAFIDSKPRPAYPFKDRDYKVNPMPADAVYYPKK